ncbi:hypothetical protein EV426DRAFT_709383 [Tirmania nivea]|nr:hypothetical protein EV426DRAFT_709383 [Tirmania nivea]
MPTSIIKMQNTITAFKSRIPVACGHHRPESTKPLICAALEELPGGMKSRIPVLKHPKRQTSSSVQNRALDTESQAALSREGITRIKPSIQCSLPCYKTVASLTKKPLLKVNSRPETSTVVTRKLSPPAGQATPAMAASSLETRKSSSSMSVISNKAVVARKPSPSTGPSTAVLNNSRKSSPPTTQSTTVMANKSVVDRKRCPLSSGSALATSNKSAVTRELFLPTGHATPVMRDNVVEIRKFSPTRKSATVISNKAVMTGKFSLPTGQSASVTAYKPVITRKLCPPTGEPVPTIANKIVGTRQSMPIMANKPVVSRNISPTSSQRTLTLLNRKMGRKANIPRPPVSSSRVQLKPAVRQTKAARYLQRMRPRNVPLPGAPQRAPKRTVLPGDYTRLKRKVGKSKLGEGSTVKSLKVSTKPKAGVKRTPKSVLGPKGRVRTWNDVSTMPLKIRVIKKTAYDTLDSFPRGKPYRYAVQADE